MSSAYFDLEAHQKKYPLRLGGLPLKEYFRHKALQEQLEREEQERVTAFLQSGRSISRNFQKLTGR